jgi:hypothetical protein
MTTSFEKNGNNYLLSKVKRRKEAICKHCNGNILPKSHAYILESDGFCSDGLFYVVGIFHLDCYEKFEFIPYIINSKLKP